MDTKLKKESGRWLITIIVICLVILPSIYLIWSYPKIGERINDNNSNVLEQSGFIADLHNSTEALYYTLKNQQDQTLKPADILLDYTKSNLTGDQKYNQKEAINEKTFFNVNDLHHSLTSLDYYVYDKENKVHIERCTEDLSLLLNEDDSHESIEEAYEYYLILDFDANGELQISSTKGLNNKTVYYELMRRFGERNEIYEGNYKTLKNVTFVYGIQKDITSSIFSEEFNRIAYYFTNQNETIFFKSAASFLITAILFIMLTALIIPYEKEKNVIGFSKFKKIYFEFHLVFVVLFTGLAYLSLSKIIMGNILGKITWFFEMDLRDLHLTSPSVFIFNLSFWFMSLGVIFLYITLIKHIIHKGFFNYLKEDTCIGKIIFVFINYFRRTVNQLLNFDLKDDENKKLLKLLGINLAILILMSSTWFFGIILAFFYTLFLFKKGKQYCKTVRANYKELLCITGEMAKGNLDVIIPENLGIFNAVQKNLNNIHTGFKKAVEEEVKSERMKTDLITNVSHDLKTPLTSIITYVDLLKNQEVTEENRKLYLDIIDNKSQRLQTLIENLFEMSKASSGSVNLNIVEVEINSLIKQILLEYSMNTEEKGLIIKLNLPEGKVILPLDSQRIFRAFENLIININKYSMLNSRVYIDVLDEDDKVQITLKNVSAQEINFHADQITERFVRGDQSRSTEGSGLGLAIAKSFVELQGGVFSVEVDGDLFKVIIVFKK